MAPLVKAPTARRSNPLTAGLRTHGRSAWGTGPKTNRARALQGATAATAAASALTMPGIAFAGDDSGSLAPLDCSSSYLAQSDVPCEVAKASLQKGVDHPAVGAYRHSDFYDATAVKKLLRMGVHEQVLVETPLDVLGIDARQPIVGDVVAPLVGVLATVQALRMINNGGYRLNPIDGSSIDERDGMKWAVYWLAVIQASYVVGHNIADLDLLFRDGSFHFEDLIINRQLTQSNFIYWAYTAPLWSAIAFLPFQFAGPFFKNIALRKTTEKGDFIQSGGFKPATPDSVAASIKDVRAEGDKVGESFSFKIPLEGLTVADKREAVASLSDDVQAKVPLSFPNPKEFEAYRDTLLAVAEVAGAKAKVKYSNVNRHKETQIEEGSLRKGARFEVEDVTPQMQQLIESGKVAASRKHDGQYVVTDKPVNVQKDLGTAVFLHIGAVETGGSFDLQGDEWLEHQEKFGPTKKWGFKTVNKHITRFTVELEGQANTLLPSLADGIGGKPFFSSMAPLDNEASRMLRRAFRRKFKPANVSITLSAGSLTKENAQAMAQVSGHNTYISKKTSVPTTTISRASIEKYAKVVNGKEVEVVVSPAQKDEFERLVDLYLGTQQSLKFEEFKDYNTKKGLLGLSESKFKTTVPAELFSKVFGDQYDTNSNLVQMFAKQQVKLVIPNNFQAPSTVGTLTAVEKVAVSTDAGSNTPLFEVEIPNENPDVSDGFFAKRMRSASIFARSTRQGNANGRFRGLFAITVSGALLSGTAGAGMKWAQGYDASIALKTAPRSLFTRGLNMSLGPAIIQSVGIENYSNWQYYSPGMHYMYLLHLPLNDATSGAGAPMMIQNHIVETRGDYRAENRAESLQKMGRLEPRVTDAKRPGVVTKKMSHFVANGMVRLDDTAVIRSHYENGLRMSDVEQSDMITARLIAAVAYDPALTWIVKEHDPDLFEQFKVDRIRLSGKINKVLAEFKLTKADLEDWG